MALCTPAHAQDQVLAAARALAPETVPLSEACGRVLARDLRAVAELPAHDLSVMDGYAVRTADLEHATGDVVLARIGESAAGAPYAGHLDSGQCVRIATGAVVPSGADAVVPQEDTVIRDGAIVMVRDRLTQMGPGRFVRKRGSETARDALVLAEGLVLGPGDVALAGASGHASVCAHRRPRVAIVSTGSELVPLGQTPGPGQIVSTNGLMLGQLAAQAGAEADDLGDVADDRQALRERLRAGLQADVLVTSGGISVGDHDLVLETLQSLGCRVVLHGVAVRPGKPFAFAIAGDTLVFALPGNPASAFVTFELFVRPALRQLAGVRGQVLRPLTPVSLVNDAPGSPTREHYLRATLAPDGHTATVLPEQMSGNLASLRACDALVRVPADVVKLPAGTVAHALVLTPAYHERWVSRR